MKLNHRQLEAFRAIIESGSVTEAAKRINVTQPAASRLLSDLELAVGYALFKRIKNRLRPTPEAIALFEEVERSFISLDTVREAAKEIGNFRRGSLLIAGMPALSLDFLPSVIAQFGHDKPDISVALHVHSSQKVLQCIASQTYDLGFTSFSDTHPGVKTELLFEAPMVAIFPLGHELCTKKTISPIDFEGRTFVSLGANYPARQRVDAVFIAANINRKLQIETQLSYSAGKIVANGHGVSIIDPITASILQGLGLIEVRHFETKILHRYHVLFPEHRATSRLTKSFLELVRQHANVLIKI